uniref:Uncharacterized protein n=1 Tax=Chromera velia CCMP2878 TaxID=1169474 RepID=A0A0G4GNA9_9ALVE|eukprot:Cvel_4960.t1-p1 / transcript=Cvel_4960.t1 / gene=Cvel_4960 / organism=Chromera_velia_CCMP2878 / gene_product=hypothetical protein / transcript_product=hypothetical protein / location=Cvel_scaffold224:49073-51699(-) / protein_length=819 / sequence_SO=supercontig / SO=protein_coding / is_pseudo=false
MTERDTSPFHKPRNSFGDPFGAFPLTSISNGDGGKKKHAKPLQLGVDCSLDFSSPLRAQQRHNVSDDLLQNSCGSLGSSINKRFSRGCTVGDEEGQTDHPQVPRLCLQGPREGEEDKHVLPLSGGKQRHGGTPSRSPMYARRPRKAGGSHLHPWYAGASRGPTDLSIDTLASFQDVGRHSHSLVASREGLGRSAVGVSSSLSGGGSALDPLDQGRVTAGGGGHIPWGNDGTDVEMDGRGALSPLTGPRVPVPSPHVSERLQFSSSGAAPLSERPFLEEKGRGGIGGMSSNRLPRPLHLQEEGDGSDGRGMSDEEGEVEKENRATKRDCTPQRAEDVGGDRTPEAPRTNPLSPNRSEQLCQSPTPHLKHRAYRFRMDIGSPPGFPDFHKSPQASPLASLASPSRRGGASAAVVGTFDKTPVRRDRSGSEGDFCMVGGLLEERRKEDEESLGNLTFGQSPQSHVGGGGATGKHTPSRVPARRLPLSENNRAARRDSTLLAASPSHTHSNGGGSLLVPPHPHHAASLHPFPSLRTGGGGAAAAGWERLTTGAGPVRLERAGPPNPNSNTHPHTQQQQQQRQGTPLSAIATGRKGLTPTRASNGAELRASRERGPTPSQLNGGGGTAGGSSFGPLSSSFSTGHGGVRANHALGGFPFLHSHQGDGHHRDDHRERERQGVCLPGELRAFGGLGGLLGSPQMVPRDSSSHPSPPSLRLVDDVTPHFGSGSGRVWSGGGGVEAAGPRVRFPGAAPPQGTHLHGEAMKHFEGFGEASGGPQQQHHPGVWRPPKKQRTEEERKEEEEGGQKEAEGQTHEEEGDDAMGV